MRLGVHLQTGGGLAATALYAQEVGAECAQIFAKSPRMWNGPEPDPVASATFTDSLRTAGIAPLFTHTAYLLNLATDAQPLRERSIAALSDELRRAALLDAEGVVTHLGSFAGDDVEVAARIAHGIAEARERAPEAEDVRVLLENSSGGGNSFGRSFAQLGELVAALGWLGVARFGVCLDTCHAHAAGIDLSSARDWDAAITELRARCGDAEPRLVHANDSAHPCGSKRDRHAWVGDGTIGEAGFAAMLADPRMAGVPAVTEASGERPEKDIVNLARLKRLRDLAGA